MTLDPDVVRLRCEEIAESLGRLRKLRESIAREAFLADRDAQDIASYRLLVAIEAALALCYHISSKRLKKVPEGYAECFGLLAEASIIPRELGERLKRTARFRNLLVHMYWKVDYGAVYDVLGTSLDDIQVFSRIVAQLV